MKFDLNEAIRDLLDFLKVRWNPSLAMKIIVPSMTLGLASLSVPIWVDVANWILVHQNFFQNYSVPLLKPNYLLGASLISLSVFVYFLDVMLKRNSYQPHQLKELPSQVAHEITALMKNTGFTAQHLQDEKIEKLVGEISSLRFFGSFRMEDKAMALAESIIGGELSGGTSQTKAKALALLARYLSARDKFENAKSWLSFSKMLCPTEESNIAHAFIEAIGSSNVDLASGLLKVCNPTNYAAFFMIKKTVEGNHAALDWLENAGLSIQDLDHDGKVVLVSVLLSEHQWEVALNAVEAIADESLSVSPALAQLSAFTLLVNAIKAVELRESVLLFVPLAADRFPLADDSESLVLRNRATQLFKVCSNLARLLGAEDVANMSDNYVLWLELRNSETHQQAMIKLQSYFINYTQKTLEYLPLAFAFGIDIDFESIESEVNRQTVLTPENNAILGLARFVLAQTQQPVSAVVDYIRHHRHQMERAVNSLAISTLEIEALVKSGLINDAQQLLQQVKDSGAPDAEISNLQSLIDSAKGADPVALAIGQYQQAKSLSDLAHLVNLLEKENRGDSYYSYCRELFDRTGQESDAIRTCNAATALGRFAELHRFLSDNLDLVKYSEGLQVHWAWCLFRKGDLLGAHEQIAMLKQSKSRQPSLKTLEINLSIFGGDWESLSIFVEYSWNSRDELKADELLQVAQLAKAVSPKRTRQILEFCTGKYQNDPQVLASSYFIATTIGLEDSQETSEWLNKAVVLSNDDGPLHSASLEDLKEMMSDTRAKNQKVYKAYFDGDAPIFSVAKLLNRTMSDFYLIQPLENKNAKDIRRKNIVPIFHGERLEQVIASETIAIDSSCALVLENIGLLAHLFDCFGKIVIPHSFMRWLFEEKQKVAFHQPSQIEKAKYFERQVSDGKISVFHPKKINNPELALNVGDELAFMLEEVSVNSQNESQALVVCSYPVYKVGGSFRDVEVDLSSFHDSLISCSQLIIKLEDLGFITEAERVKALNYLRQHEKEWPTDLDVVRGARLFLDSLSITYLMAVDMLDKLSEAGFEVYVFKGERDRYRSLINYDSITEQADSKIENIRKLFSKGLETGKVILAEMQLNREQVAASNHNYAMPTEELFEALKLCDAALIDDRFMNRNKNLAFDERELPIYSSLDFIETLHHKGLISKEQKLDARTSLRELGFEFVAITSEELEYHLDHSAIVGSEFKPTKQLRQIKENLLLTRISGLVQLPRDALWLHGTMKTIAKALKTQWSDDIPPELSRIRSCWLYELIGYREWAQTHQIRGDGELAYFGEVLKVNAMLFVPESVTGKQKEGYQAWVDEFVLAPMKDIDPLSFQHLIESMKLQVKSISHQAILEEGLDG